MRHLLRLSPSAFVVLLALVIPSFLVAEAARSSGAASREEVSPRAQTDAPSPRPEVEGAAASRARENYGRLPLSFEANRGQAGGRVQFLARSDAYSLYLTPDGMTFSLRDAAARGGSVLRIQFQGAGRPRVHGLEELEGKSNYLVGRDPARWRMNVPNYGRVRYEGVYPGVDVLFYGTQRQLEYDFALAPGADAGLIRMRVEGAKELRITPEGDLVLPTAAGEVRQHAPKAYQEIEGVRRAVDCRYVLRGAGRVGFELGAYDRSLPLVIDPVVSYATYLGGNNYDGGNAVAVDAQGSAYVVGFTASLDFPVTPGAFRTSHGNQQMTYPTHDAFVAKLNPAGTALVYSTYLGGNDYDMAMSVALDGAGQAYVAGVTHSANFPTTPGAYRTARPGLQDVFVSKLGATGAELLYSTYLGGSGYEYEPRLALGGGGEVYVGGQTGSANFPVTPGAFQTQPGSMYDGFVTKLSASPGAGLLFSTFLGGAAEDTVEGLAVASGLDDSVYVTGRTSSQNFPTTPGAFRTANADATGTFDAFVTRLNSAGTQAVYSTYFGGAGYEYGKAIAVDGAGAAYVAGYTSSDSGVATEGAFQTAFAGGSMLYLGFPTDAFVAKFTPDGAGLAYATYLGGYGDDQAYALAVDAQGNAYAAGTTGAADFPVTPDALEHNFDGGQLDGFVVKLNPAGSGLSYGSYFGGTQWDVVKGVGLGAGGDVYLTGETYSVDLVTTGGAVQPNSNVGTDAFLARIDLDAQSYRVSGRVTNEYGNGLREVEVRASGAVNKTARTDDDGYYTVNGIPPGGQVTLTASRRGFVFEPQQGVTLSNISRDETVDFSGPAPLLLLGRVTSEDGYNISVPVTLTGGAGEVTYTDWYEGTYAFSVPAGGDYTVTPGPDPDYTFAPVAQSAQNLTGDQTFDFVAQRRPRIGGQVIQDIWGIGLPGVRVTLTSPSLPEPLVQTTDPSGYFDFPYLERGATYTVTPSLPGTNHSFAPEQQTFADIRQVEFVTFRALMPLSIHGWVRDANGNAVSGVATLTGTVNAEVPVDVGGFFTFSDLPRGGDYTVTVTKPDSLYTFTPPSRTVTDMQEMQFFEFEALPPLRIMGFVSFENNGAGGVPATVTLSGTVNQTVQADQWGNFAFLDLPRGGDYTVTPSYPLHTFAPESQSVTNAQADQVFAFEALPPLRIDGYVRTAEWGSIAGATVTLSGAVNATAQTDEYGMVSFRDLPRGGNYTVALAHDHYIFTPQGREFPALNRNEVAEFEGALRRFTLGGRVADVGGAPLSGVTMTLSGAASATAQTDANGNYAFANLPIAGAYTVTAARPGFAFAPPSFGVHDLRSDQQANFTATRLTYTISGRITDSTGGGAGISGATITLSGSSSATTQTDEQGNYAFTGLPSEGDYTLRVSHPHFYFGGFTFGYNNLLADVTTANFSGQRLNHLVTGRVTDAAGRAVGGVTVTLGGAYSGTRQTNGLGEYSFSVLPAGLDYTLTASKEHYTFSPQTRQIEDLGADTTADFTGTLLAHNITGRVVDSGGNAFAGVTVSLTGTRGGSATTDAAGNYSFNALPAGGFYTVEPSRQFYDFGPVRAVFNDLGADQSANFTATLRTFQIGGRVAEGATGLAGVTVNLSGTRTAATQTDAAGNYLFTSLPADGTYTVTAAATAVYAFTPAGASFNTLPSNQTANFSASRLLYQVSGYALDPCGRALGGLTMSLTRDGATAVTAQTNAAGFYTFTGVPAGYNYTLSPTGSAYTFAPPSYLLPNLDSNRTANFTGTPPVTTTDVFALADLYVRGGSATSNFGTATQLISRLANQTKDTYETYLKFDVGRPCTVASVKLRLYGQASSSGTLPLALYGVPVTTWSETTTTWNNKPAAGALLRTVNVTGTTAGWYEWDVTDYVRSEVAAGRTTVSFVLKGAAQTSYQATFNSRQAAGTNAPRLAVTTP